MNQQQGLVTSLAGSLSGQDNGVAMLVTAVIVFVVKSLVVMYTYNEVAPDIFCKETQLDFYKAALFTLMIETLVH